MKRTANKEKKSKKGAKPNEATTSQIPNAVPTITVHQESAFQEPPLKIKLQKTFWG